MKGDALADLGIIERRDGEDDDGEDGYGEFGEEERRG